MRNFFYIALVVVLAFLFSLVILERGSLAQLFNFGIENDRHTMMNQGLILERELDNFIELLKNGESDELNRVVNNISYPQPLVGRGGSETSVLTKEGIFSWTNKNRTAYSNFLSFSPNAELDAAAESRMNDMFNKQYFDHVSPEGTEISKVAENFGYQYIAVGENIALGNFPSDEALVEAWMDSPGHRENILNGGFTELGVAVGQGIFEGETVWISVQVFGRPLSDCPEPDHLLSLNIEENQGLIGELEEEIEKTRSEIEDSDPGSQERADLIEQHNFLVEQINSLILETKGLIEKFNLEVSEFNSCITNPVSGY